MKARCSIFVILAMVAGVACGPEKPTFTHANQPTDTGTDTNVRNATNAVNSADNVAAVSTSSVGTKVIANGFDAGTQDANVTDAYVPSYRATDGSYCVPNETVYCEGLPCSNGKAKQLLCNSTGTAWLIWPNGERCGCPEDWERDTSVPDAGTVKPDATQIDARQAPDASARADGRMILIPLGPPIYFPGPEAPDAQPATPDTRVVNPPSMPQVPKTPDAGPDIAPDVSEPDVAPPDASPDTAPDVSELDVPSTPDVGPDMEPDTTPNIVDASPAPDLTPDTPPACIPTTPWKKELKAELKQYACVDLTWETDDCSKKGFKIIWRQYNSDDPTSLLPTYPDNYDGYEFLGAKYANNYTVENLSSGTWVFRACKYMGNGVCGEYSNTVTVIIP